MGGVTESFAHDLDGNMTSRTVGGVTTNFHWDQDFRLKRINSGAEQLYDAEGIRKKTGATSFYSSGAASIADRGAANLTYVQGHQIMASANGATVLYYLHDGLSSVRALADAGGTVTANLDYDEFGAPVTATSNPHSYVGGLGVRNETSASSKLYYMRQRWYASDLGRFISADPIGFAGGLNLYNYGNQNPVNFVDPSGLDAWSGLSMTQVAKVSPQYVVDQFQDQIRRAYLDPRVRGSTTANYAVFLIAMERANDHFVYGNLDNWNSWKKYGALKVGRAQSKTPCGLRGKGGGLGILEKANLLNGRSADDVYSSLTNQEGIVLGLVLLQHLHDEALKPGSAINSVPTSFGSLDDRAWILAYNAYNTDGSVGHFAIGKNGWEQAVSDTLKFSKAIKFP